MNYQIILSILGSVFLFESAFLLLPCMVALIYGENVGINYFFVAVFCVVIGLILRTIKPSKKTFYAKEGFVTVSISWILVGIMSAMPFYISGEIPSPVDALFESISGLTTTGATILQNVEILSHTALFWRSFTHWIGGMGVLVFLLAILPLGGKYTFKIMRTESPGPIFGKLLPKMQYTALLLYAIYVMLTILNIIFLLIGKMPLFDALITAFSTAGTGGFSMYNTSIAAYPSPYIQWVVTVFMILFGVSFNLYYLILAGKPLKIFKISEVKYYLGIIFVAAVLIILNTVPYYRHFSDCIRHSFFQVAAIITTTGFSTVNFDLWPDFSKAILVILMFIGACAGSTGGGIKVSRVMIMAKTVKKELAHLLHPSSIKIITIDGKPIEHDVIRSVNIFLISYIGVLIFSFLLVSLDNFGFTTSLTSVITTLNNVGPGLGLVGPSENFAKFSILSKFVLMFNMLAGRLEIFPMLLIFIPATWKK